MARPALAQPLDAPATGIALMSAAMLLAPLLDVFSKLLTETVSPGQAAIGRFVAQSLFLLPVLAMLGEWTRPTRLHAVAGALLGIAIFCINSALAVMPVANAIAIFFVEPLILTLLSALILGERLGWRRLSAVAVGLAGAMIVLRPNLAAFGPEAALPLVTAFAFACYLLITRVMSQRGARWALQFWNGLFAILTLLALSLVAAPLGIASAALGPMGWHEIGLMAAMGLVACTSHQLLAQAFARAEAGAL
ncbi:MAG: DMT family transporter, partial [Pseudomonadota bacterium]